MRKKFNTMLLLLLVCLQLTGCSLPNIQETIDNISAKIDDAQFEATVSLDNKFPMKKETKEAQDRALRMQEKASDWRDADANTSWKSFPPFFKKFVTSSMLKKRTSDTVTARDNYESTKESDDIFQTAKENASIFGDKELKSFKSPIIIVVILLILALVAGLLFLLKRKRVKPTQIKETDKTTESSVTSTQPTLVERDDQKSIESCKKYCKKFDIDYDTMLAKYGGDPKALLDMLVVSRKEDFHIK